MPTPTKWTEPRTITIETTEAVRASLESLAACGWYGRGTIESAAEELLREKVRELEVEGRRARAGR